MNAFLRLFAGAVLAILVVPRTAQREMPMRGNTPVAPQGLKIPPLLTAPVRYETGEVAAAPRRGAVAVCRRGRGEADRLAGGWQGVR